MKVSMVPETIRDNIQKFREQLYRQYRECLKELRNEGTVRTDLSEEETYRRLCGEI